MKVKVYISREELIAFIHGEDAIICPIKDDLNETEIIVKRDDLAEENGIIFIKGMLYH